MGTPPLRRMSRSALVHLKGEKEFSLGGYLAPPVMFAKRKGIPVERSDLSLGKGYPAAAFAAAGESPTMTLTVLAELNSEAFVCLIN